MSLDTQKDINLVLEASLIIAHTHARTSVHANTHTILLLRWTGRAQESQDEEENQKSKL